MLHLHVLCYEHILENRAWIWAKVVLTSPSLNHSKKLLVSTEESLIFYSFHFDINSSFPFPDTLNTFLLDSFTQLI